MIHVRIVAKLFHVYYKMFHDLVDKTTTGSVNYKNDA